MLEALDLFSRYGYSDVSMESIATNVGIKAPSVYKHYKNKEAILISIMKLGTDRFVERIKECTYHDNPNNEDDFNIRLEKIGINILQIFLHDEYISKVRKILSIEIYKNKDMMNLYIKQYIEQPLQKHQDIITYLGIDKKEVGILAFAFYSPIYLALRICDSDPSREDEMLELLRNTYAHFNALVELKRQ